MAPSWHRLFTICQITFVSFDRTLHLQPHRIHFRVNEFVVVTFAVAILRRLSSPSYTIGPSISLFFNASYFEVEASNV